MKNKKYINRYIEFKIRNQQVNVKGILLDYSNEWTLLLNNPVDYVIDGYVIIRNSLIEKYYVQRSTTLTSKVLFKKSLSSNLKKIDISTSETLFRDLFRKKIVFSISNTKNNSFVIGGIKKITDMALDLAIINSKAKWSKIKNKNINEIGILEFDTDYIDSLLLISRKPWVSEGSRT
jgi:hypothetical protein